MAARISSSSSTAVYRSVIATDERPSRVCTARRFGGAAVRPGGETVPQGVRGPIVGQRVGHQLADPPSPTGARLRRQGLCSRRRRVRRSPRPDSRRSLRCAAWHPCRGPGARRRRSLRTRPRRAPASAPALLRASPKARPLVRRKAAGAGEPTRRRKPRCCGSCGASRCSTPAGRTKRECRPS
jgi:hypothetical protein